MGGCVVSLMSARNQSSEVPNEWVQRCLAYGQVNTALAGTETAAASAVLRNAKLSGDAEYRERVRALSTGPNLVQRLAAVCARDPQAPRILYRPVERRAWEHVPAAARALEVTYLGPTRRLTLGEMWEHIESFGRGLGRLGLPAGSHVSLYEETRWEWLVSIYGVWMQGLVASTVYANLGLEALYYALRETQSAAVVCSGKAVATLLKGIAAGAFDPCVIVYLDALPADTPEPPAGVRVLAWADVLAMGRDDEGRKVAVAVPANNDALALIMYTSGTTGDPKGVMHTHGSLTSGVQAMELFLDSNCPAVPDECYCAYLPLAHILEFGVVSLFLTRGTTVGFGSPRTLTDASARPHGDLQEYRPHILVAVPRVFDTVKRGVEAKLPPPGTLKRQVFDAAYRARLDALRRGMDTPFFNERVFAQARQALGGRFHMLLSGGGLTSPATQEFINVVFGFVISGWGLTETVCVGAIQRIGDMEPMCVGQVLETAELKLADTAAFKHTDKPEPRGEICLRGPFLFKGYYKQPELTKEAIDADGWFHTGDVGAITADNKVRVIDRVKALAKNVLGEYVAQSLLESIYSAHELVADNCACVVVNPYRSYISLIVASDEARVVAFARRRGIPVPDAPRAPGAGPSVFAAVTNDPRFVAAAEASLAQMGIDAGRARFELVRHVFFTDDVWTPESGELTAAMKIRRTVIEKKYAHAMRKLFPADEA